MKPAQWPDSILEKTLQDQFGFDSFREGQKEAIQKLDREKRLLCIQPTGYGKSLLYQLPAALLGGVTLVISPLLALMRDQMRHLNQHYGIPAASINSDQSPQENEEAQRLARQNELDILFIAPEQLDNLDRLDFLMDLQVDLVVVDESHCISTWGHDFRPSYREIAKFVHKMGAKNPELLVLGLTATADKRVEEDIQKQLAPAPDQPLSVLRRSMNRPNLSLAVKEVGAFHEKLAYLSAVLKQLDPPGLIYCATREHTEIVAEYLQSEGINVPAYHAGFDENKKRELQEAFINDDFDAVASTNALGMGIDKENLRFVIHADVPGSITSYYQEVGRAGRDRKPSQGILIFNEKDKSVQEYFIFSSQPDEQDFRTVLETVAKFPEHELPRMTDIKRESGLHPTLVRVIVAELRDQEFLNKIRQNGSQVYQPTGKESEPDLDRYRIQSKVKFKELRKMMKYGSSNVGCLMAYLRENLGDQETEPCGNCHLCVDSELLIETESDKERGAMEWLRHRPTAIRGYYSWMEDGLFLFDGAQRLEGFKYFMKNRRRPFGGIEADLKAKVLDPLQSVIRRLSNQYNFQTVIPIPSRTWGHREEVAGFIAGQIEGTVLLDFLQWDEDPEYRQGQLLNNDQRRDNVDRLMTVNPGASRHIEGDLILLDDYVGSRATLREAARVLKKSCDVTGSVVPLTIARVQWKLGSTGFV